MKNIEVLVYSVAIIILALMEICIMTVSIDMLTKPDYITLGMYMLIFSLTIWIYLSLRLVNEILKFMKRQKEETIEMSEQ